MHIYIVRIYDSRVHVIGCAVLRMVIVVRLRSIIVVIVDYCPRLGSLRQDLAPRVRARDVISFPTDPSEPEKHEGRYESKEPSHGQDDDGVGNVEGSVMGDIVVDLFFDLHVKIGDHTDGYPYQES